MSTGSDHFDESWHAFLRQWIRLRAEWNDAVSEEVTRRWVDKWESVIGDYGASLREAERFLRQAGQDVD